MASRYATRPGRPSVNSTTRHHARSMGHNDSSSTSNINPSYQRRFANDTTAEEEDSSETSSFPMWKSLAVVAVVIGCFAAVYPKMFHPMLLYALGYGQNQRAEENEIFPHPAMKHGSGSGPPRQASFAGPSTQQHERQHGSFPGARSPMPGMGAGMPGMGEAGKAGSKSMWHWMLPFYTIGVILFLLYTLSKILWKKPKVDGARRRLNMRYNAATDRMETDDPEFDDEDYDEEEDDENAPNGTMNNRQLRGLQRRLQDTEQTMHEILSQLEQLSTTADPNAAEHIKKMTLDTLNNLGKLNADRASSRTTNNNGDLGFSGLNTTAGRAGSVRFDATERRYLNELQKALSDFKQFTENYIDEHAAKHPDGDKENKETQDESRNDEEENIEPSASNDETEIDVMESEKTCSVEELKVEKGEGELIPVNEENDGVCSQGEQKEEDFSPMEEIRDNEKGEEDFEQSKHVEEKKNKKHVRQRKGKKQIRYED